MDQSLKDAATQGSIDALYALIKEDANVLDRIDNIPFVDTPLHLAASGGHTQFVMEIMRLKPSFSRKCNEDSFTLVHLALQKDQIQLVYRLVAVDRDLVYVTIQGDTIFHIALNNNHLDAFEYLIRWVQWTMIEDASFWEKTLLNWKDKEGNTVLHIAVVRWLLKAGVRINRKNLRGLTALDILQGQMQIDNNEMKAMLVRAGASSGSPPRVKPYEAFLKSHRGPIYSIYRSKSVIQLRREKRNMTNELPSMLVVVVLFITTY
ncbi:hypothetical protein FH972_012317 [Carpinus fangiana]|uniref:Uncharacterized protein n=1 Tax=Carpinus fangiana TaxID=176857 RepID=A0A5N6R6S8_9ROSI|nr:hypothetical protein FH972_012317 [Carpinus fangiana]